MEYPELASKTIKTAKSWIENNGVAYLELAFSDDTSFIYESSSNPKVWARTYNSNGDVMRAWV